MSEAEFIARHGRMEWIERRLIYINHNVELHWTALKMQAMAENKIIEADRDEWQELALELLKIHNHESILDRHKWKELALSLKDELLSRA